MKADGSAGREMIVGQEVKKYNNPQEEEHGTGVSGAVLGPVHLLKPREHDKKCWQAGLVGLPVT